MVEEATLNSAVSGLPGTTLMTVIPGTAALVIVAELTNPSVSLADSAVTPPTPAETVSVAGQFGTTGSLTGPPHGAVGLAVLRGTGAPLLMSAPLLSESVQPPSARRPASVFVRDGAAAA